MVLNKLGKIISGQDGAVFNGLLFRFDEKGNCSVYKLNELANDSIPFAKFTLDKAEIIAPHSNSVAFSNAYYNQEDEFPLLYSNVYNNYQNCANKLKGVTCVYRLQKNGNEFSTTLIQLIEIGFTEDALWRSENQADVRPYGNFAIDAESSIYYAFTMRDEDNCTRYFSFKLPSFESGVYDDTFGVKKVILNKEDIIDFFDCEYHRFIQGACFYDGIIYSVEGFTNDQKNPPAIRLIDTKNKNQQSVYYFADFGLTIEPELIDFEDKKCYYADNSGNVYEIVF